MSCAVSASRAKIRWRRKIPSYLVGKLASRLVGVEMRDYGSMLRAYRRPVIDQLLRCQDRSMYIPALANAFAASVAEIPVDHQRRAAGRSRYNFFGLLRLTADLVTGFSLWPIRIVALAGTLLGLLGVGFGLYTGLQSLRGSPQTTNVGPDRTAAFCGEACSCWPSG